MIVDPARDRLLVYRTCLVYLTIFAWSGFNQPYLPLWLAARGLSEPQIALVVGLPMFTRILVTPVLGRIADQVPDRRIMIRWLTLGALGLALVLWNSNGFWPILIFYVLMMALLQNVSPIFDASALDLVRRGVVREFGRLRLWGSAGYAFTSLIGGTILWWGGSDAVYAAFLIAVAAMLLASYALPPPPPAPPQSAAREKALLRPAVLIVIVAGALTLASQATWNGFGAIRLKDLGVPQSLIGLVWAAATIAEIGMFWAGPILARWMGPYGILMIAAAGSALRWTLMAFDPSAPVMVLVQMMHALTFSCAHLGVMGFLAVAVNIQRGASAQAAFVTISAIILGAATIAAGPLYKQFAGFAYLGSAALPALALIILMAFRSRIVQELAEHERTTDGKPAS